MTRKQLLEDLLVLKSPLNEVLSDLAEFGWDCDTEIVRIRRDHVVRVLERFRNGEISDRDVSYWADAIECRDDIGSEKGCEEILEDVTNELANPELTRPLSSETAGKWIYRLRSSVIGSEDEIYQKQIPEDYSHTDTGRKKRLIPVDELLAGRLTEIAESKQIPSETLIELWLKEKISESYQQA